MLHINKHEILVKMKERELMFSANGYNGSGGFTDQVRIKIGKVPLSNKDICHEKKNGSFLLFFERSKKRSDSRRYLGAF